MTPAARIQTVITLLEKIGGSRIPMDAVIGDYMRTRRYIGSKDRAFIAETVYEIMRAHARLGWWLEKTGTDDTPRNRIISYLVLTGQETIEHLFDGSKYGPARLTKDEQNIMATLNGHGLKHSGMPASVRVECPPFYEQSLREYFGDAFEEEMSAMIPAATLDLRVNIGKHTREDIQQSLQQNGVETAPAPYSPWALRATQKAFLSKTKAFKKGWIAIQDEGSQLIALACNAQSGMAVLDYCAGAGGKTLAIAACMENKGRIVACDTEASRLEKARPRFRRAGVHDIIETRPLNTDQNRKWLRRQKGTFDVVLADVPCSGTGTWRRNPDMRWRTYGPPLEDLIRTQSDILDKIAKTVKPGGMLVYATCSLLPEENEKQAEAFLKRHPEFSTRPPPNIADSCLSGPFLRLTPHRHNTDGFFAACFIKAQA